MVHAGTDVLRSPRRPRRGARPAFPRKRPPPRGFPVTRRTRPGATSRTARRSASPPRRCSAAPPRCPGWRTAATAPSWRWADAAAAPAPPSAAPPGNGITAGAGSRAASPAGSTCTPHSSIGHGGRTDLALVPGTTTTRWHDRGYLIAAPPAGGGASGSTARTSPRQSGPPADPPYRGNPARYGERLLTTPCTARPTDDAQTGTAWMPTSQPGPRHLHEPEDWPERTRQYEARTPRRFAPILTPARGRARVG